MDKLYVVDKVTVDGQKVDPASADWETVLRSGREDCITSRPSEHDYLSLPDIRHD